MPRTLLERCLGEFPGSERAEHIYDRAQERLKTSYSPEILRPHSRQLFYAFNSRPFIQIIENISGIRGLIPDPYFLGGGFQDIAEGGNPSSTADFNRHPSMNLSDGRMSSSTSTRIGPTSTVASFLQLWDNDMKHCIHSYVPLFNRCVIFNTTSKSNHGNPTPVHHPNGLSRRSIALYYYTATWDGSKRDHTTQFRVRPESDDRADVKVKRREVTRDLVPPLLYRGARRLKQQFSRHR